MFLPLEEDFLLLVDCDSSMEGIHFEGSWIQVLLEDAAQKVDLVNSTTEHQDIPFVLSSEF